MVRSENQPPVKNASAQIGSAASKENRSTITPVIKRSSVAATKPIATRLGACARSEIVWPMRRGANAIARRLPSGSFPASLR